jgi:hypothetical protein
VKGEKGVKHATCPEHPEPVPVKLATDKQKHWCATLIVDREVSDEQKTWIATHLAAGTLTFDQASKALDVMFKLPHVGQADLPGEDAVPAGRYALDNGDGTYLLVKVWRKNGRVNVYDDDEYGRKHPLATLKAIEDAGALESAQLYGHLRHRCSRCGTTLKNRLSVHLGLGTDCVMHYANGKEMKEKGRRELRDQGIDPYETVYSEDHDDVEVEA